MNLSNTALMTGKLVENPCGKQDMLYCSLSVAKLTIMYHYGSRLALNM